MIMARFITLHNEIMRDTLVIEEVYVNVEQITYISRQNGRINSTLVCLPSGFVEVKETPEEIMRIITNSGVRCLRGD